MAGAHGRYFYRWVSVKRKWTIREPHSSAPLFTEEAPVGGWVCSITSQHDDPEGARRLLGLISRHASAAFGRRHSPGLVAIAPGLRWLARTAVVRRFLRVARATEPVEFIERASIQALRQPDLLKVARHLHSGMPRFLFCILRGGTRVARHLCRGEFRFPDGLAA